MKNFLSWCNADFDAELHLEVEKNPNFKGSYKKIFGVVNQNQAHLKKILLILLIPFIYQHLETQKKN